MTQRSSVGFFHSSPPPVTVCRLPQQSRRSRRSTAPSMVHVIHQHKGTVNWQNKADERTYEVDCPAMTARLRSTGVERATRELLLLRA